MKYWVLRRAKTRPKKKVIVAAARKLAEGVWRLFALGELRQRLVGMVMIVADEEDDVRSGITRKAKGRLV